MMLRKPWTEKEIIELREMWAAGVTAKFIARHPTSAGRRSQYSIANKANCLGLPRRYGRGTGWRDDPTDFIEEVRVAYVDNGWPVHRIAVKMGCHANTIYNIIRDRKFRRGNVDIVEPPGIIRCCMTCGCEFRSPSNGVRMCDHCRATADTSMSEYTIHSWAA